MGAKRTSFFTLNWSLIIIIITWFSVFCVSVKHHPLVQFWKALVHFFCRRSEAWLNGTRLMPWVTKRIWSDSGKSFRIELTYGKNTTTSYQKIHFGNSAWLNAHLIPSKRMNFILRSCLIQKDPKNPCKNCCFDWISNETLPFEDLYLPVFLQQFDRDYVTRNDISPI